MARPRHELALWHTSYTSNSTAVTSNHRPAADGLGNVVWSAVTAGVSYASNSNDVATVGGAGASTLVSRADHVHRGVQSVSHTSNTFYGPITLAAEGTVGITSPTSGTYVFNAGAGGGGSSSPTAVGARVYRSTNQGPITTQTAIQFNGEDWDTHGFHSTVSNTDRLTIPAGKGGLYLMVGNVYVNSIGSTNYVHARITKNGLAGANFATVRVARSPDDNTLLTITGLAQLAVGDFVLLTIESDDTSFTVVASGTGGGGGVPSFQIALLGQ